MIIFMINQNETGTNEERNRNIPVFQKSSKIKSNKINGLQKGLYAAFFFSNNIITRTKQKSD